MSSKGQIVVPKEIRDSQGWDAGTEFEFVERGQEVLVRPVQQPDPRFPPISMEELLSRAVRIDRFPTDEEIEETLLSEAVRRFDATRR